MTSKHDKLPGALGFLRAALLGLALLNLLLPTIDMLAPFAAGGGEHNLMSVLATVVAPVMAPLLMVGLLIDYIMSRVRAADAAGAQRALFVKIGRIELAVLVITLLFWIPYFKLKLL